MIFTGCSSEGSIHLFSRLSEKNSGVNFRNTLFEDGPLNVANYIYFYNGGGVAIGDINNDGLQDILFTGNMVKNRLFLNKGNFEFDDITMRSGVAEKQGWCTGATMADINGDGKLDIYICRSADGDPQRRENLLFINNDGWPDIVVSNDFNEPDYLFTNNRDGTFTEQLSKCMDETSLFSMGSDAADYNNDGFIDLVTLDMLAEDNKTQKMHSGAENFDKFQFMFNQGFYYQYSRNMLQKNNGDGTFSEVGQLSGVSNTDWSWAALFGDYDNDGNKDLFVTNGYVKDYTDMDFIKYSINRIIRSMNKDTFDATPEYIKKMPTIQIANYIFQNNGNETFTKKSTEWGFTKQSVSAGAAYAD